MKGIEKKVGTNKKKERSYEQKGTLRLKIGKVKWKKGKGEKTIRKL